MSLSIVVASALVVPWGWTSDEYFAGTCTPIAKAIDGSAAADIDGDGRDEVIAITQSTLFGPWSLTAYSFSDSGEATQLVASGTNPSGAPTSDRRLIVGDFTNDGIADFLYATFPGIVVVPGSSGGFLPHYVATTTPATPELGDLDNDGDLDLVTGALSGTDVQSHLNDGFGAIASTVISQSGNTAALRGVRLGDFDVDGRLDAATCATQTFVSSHVAVQLGAGAAGSFAPATGSPFFVGLGSGTTNGLAAADVDSDGDADVVVQYAGTRLLRSNGATFGPIVVVGDGSDGLSIVDLDGDTLLDVVCRSSSSNGIQVVLDPAGVPSIGKLETSHFTNWPIAGRFTGAANRDLAMCDTITGFAITGPRGTITCVKNDGSNPLWLGVPTGKSVLSSLGNVVASRSVDFDGDSHPDLLLVTHGASTRIVVMRGDGALGFTGGSSSAIFASVRDIEVGDLDNDGDLDVAAAGLANLATLHRQTTPGNLDAGFALPWSGGSASLVELADVDLDGNLDVLGGVILGSQSEIRTARNTNPATLSFAELAAMPVGGTLVQFEAANLDLDTDLDLVAARVFGGWYELATSFDQGSAFSAFTSVAPLSFHAIASGPFVEDFDGDGRADVLVRVRDATPAARVLFGRGIVGGFLPFEEFAVDETGVDVTAGDLDCDGQLDVLVENGDYDTQDVWERGPSGNFSVVARHPGIAKLARLDDDLAVDRFTVTSAGPEIVLLRNRSPGSVQSVGTSCAFSGVSPPTLSASKPALAGQPFTLSLSNGFGGATAILFFGSKTTSVPVGLGCSFYLTSLAPTPVVFPLPGSGPGQGSISIPTSMPVSLAGICFAIQAATIEGPTNYTLSNALSIFVE